MQVVALSCDWLVWLRLSTVIGWSNLNNINQSRPFLNLSQLILSVFNGGKKLKSIEDNLSLNVFQGLRQM